MASDGRGLRARIENRRWLIREQIEEERGFVTRSDVATWRALEGVRVT